MNYENYFKCFFESISDNRKIVLILFLITDDKNLLKELGFNKNVLNQLSLEFENILLEQHENYLDCVKDQDQSIIEKILYK